MLKACQASTFPALLCISIGSVFYALLITSVAFVMENVDKGGSRLANHIWEVKEYLRNKKVRCQRASIVSSSEHYSDTPFSSIICDTRILYICFVIIVFGQVPVFLRDRVRSFFRLQYAEGKFYDEGAHSGGGLSSAKATLAARSRTLHSHVLTCLTADARERNR